MKNTTRMVLVMVALMGQARAQETFNQPDQVCAYVVQALPWLVTRYGEIICTPVVLEVKVPPWLIYGGGETIMNPLPDDRLRAVSPVRPADD